MTTVNCHYYDHRDKAVGRRGAMRFACDGVSYSSDDLLVYRTTDAHRPMVYMTYDYTCVFVVVVTRWDGAHVRRVSDPAEIKRMAAHFGIDELLRAVR